MARAPRSARAPATIRARPPRPRGLVLPRTVPDTDEQPDARDVPFIAWPDFRTEYPIREPPPMTQAEMITLLGLKGSGKTTLATQWILPQFPIAVVLATKRTDPVLYGTLRKQGYHFTDNPKFNFRKYPKVVFKPKMRGLAREAIGPLRAQFLAALEVIYALGKCAVYADEIRYLTDNLKLETEIVTLWLQGRSELISMIAATQEPVGVPRVVFNQIDHLFTWKYSQIERVKTAAEMAGNSYPQARATIPILRLHEAMYVRKLDDLVVRTRFQR